VTGEENGDERVGETCEIGDHAMIGEQRKISPKDVVICAAFIWAYQEYAKSQQLRGTPLSLDEITDYRWKQLKHSGKAYILNEGYKKLFHFLFQKEFKTLSSSMENARTDVIEQAELFFKKIGYEPAMKIRR
jgi:hypothetical protein